MSLTLCAAARARASGLVASSYLPTRHGSAPQLDKSLSVASKALDNGSVRYKSSKGGSSKRYMARQLNDPYVKARTSAQVSSGRTSTQKKLGGANNVDVAGLADEAPTQYVSRSAFKLVELDERSKHDKRGRGGRILRPGAIVVDLGAAPGGWTQVALESQCAHVFALDLLPLHTDVRAAGSQSGKLTEMMADIRQPETRMALRKDIMTRHAASAEGQRDSNSRGDAYVDTVLSDMMANTSGNPIRDSQLSLDLIELAFDFARRVLRPSLAKGKPSTRDAQEDKDKPAAINQPSTLILKYFASPEADDFRKEVLQPAFESVASVKVKASRKESREAYLVCRGLRPSFALD